MVIVKKSSPKNLSADSQPTVGRLLADSWLTVGCLSADRRPTGFARNKGYLSADSGPTVGRQLTNSQPKGFLGSSSSQLPRLQCGAFFSMYDVGQSTTIPYLNVLLISVQSSIAHLKSPE